MEKRSISFPFLLTGEKTPFLLMNKRYRLVVCWRIVVKKRTFNFFSIEFF